MTVVKMSGKGAKDPATPSRAKGDAKDKKDVNSRRQQDYRLQTSAPSIGLMQAVPNLTVGATFTVGL